MTPALRVKFLLNCIQQLDLELGEASERELSLAEGAGHWLLRIVEEEWRRRAIER